MTYLLNKNTNAIFTYNFSPEHSASPIQSIFWNHIFMKPARIIPTRQTAKTFFSEPSLEHQRQQQPRKPTDGSHRIKSSRAQKIKKKISLLILRVRVALALRRPSVRAGWLWLMTIVSRPAVQNGHTFSHSWQLFHWLEKHFPVRG